MQEHLLFTQAGNIRAKTLDLLAGITEEQANVIPSLPGFRNHLRWQAGHILYTQEVLARKFAGIAIEFGDDWKGWFGNGSAPAAWQSEPPSLEELRERLTGQTARIAESLAGRLDEQLGRPFLGNGTVGEVLVYSLYHEGVHTGQIAALRKLVL